MSRVVVALSVSFSLASVVACSSSSTTSPASSSARAPTAAPPAAATSADAATTTATVKETPYDIEINAPSALVVGDQTAFTAKVTAKDGFHINAEYPSSFRPDPDQKGVKFPAEKITLADSSSTEACAGEAHETCAFSARVPFVLADAATTEAKGVLAFSVCSDEKCLIEKVPLQVALAVHERPTAGP